MQGTESRQWGAIAIRSGMSGMAAAAALSNVGHRVLLLEQYQTLGCLTHSSSLEGFTWDAEIHYLSGISGQDVVSPGIPTGLGGGLLAAAIVDPKAFRHCRR